MGLKCGIVGLPNVGKSTLFNCLSNAKAQAANFRVLRTQDLADLGVKFTVLQTPEGMSASRGLKRLRKLDPQGTYDYNHVYFDSGDASQTVGEPAAVPFIASPNEE